MIWTTAKSTEVSRPQSAFADDGSDRACGPGRPRPAAGPAMVAIGGAPTPVATGRRRVAARGARVERLPEVGDEVRLVLEPDGAPGAGPG